MAKVKRPFEDESMSDMDKPVLDKFVSGREEYTKVEEVVGVKEQKVIVEEPPAWPKKYICRVKRWVSSKCQLYYPGDVVEFSEGEMIPDGFDLVG
jgi:hypothetical protein